MEAQQIARPVHQAIVERACGCKSWFENRREVKNEMCKIHKAKLTKPIRRRRDDDEED